MMKAIYFCKGSRARALIHASIHRLYFQLESMGGTLVTQALVISQLLLVVLSEYQRTETYHDQKVVKCELHKNFQKRLQILLRADFVDPWGVDREGRLHVRLSDRLWSELQSILPECSVAIDNVEEHVKKGEMAMTESVGTGWFEKYHPYEEIVEWYQSLAKNHSKIVTYVDSIGESIEGKDIPAVHFTASTTTPTHTIYFQCLIHAREWISGSVCMYIANHLSENYGKDTQVTNLLDSLQFVIVPIVNPDGYNRTWNGDRLWRNNCRVNSGSDCMGVDLNRNYNDHWGDEEGSSSNPCSDTYHGVSAASEPETQATQEYFAKQNGVIAAIDWHSYSQLVMRPYGCVATLTHDEVRLREIGDKMAQDIFRVEGVSYTSETAVSLYPACGTALGWFYGEEATKTNNGYHAASFTIELRDNKEGKYGFELPPDQIIPNAKEVTPAVLNMAESILDDPILSIPDYISSTKSTH